MPIRLVINGFPRSGTTILLDVIKHSVPSDWVVLYEILSEQTWGSLKTGIDMTRHDYVNISVVDEFNKLDDIDKNEFVSKWFNYFTNCTEHDKVIQLLKTIHKSRKNIVIKEIVLQYVLSRIVNEFNCKVLYIIRDLVNVVNDHLIRNSMIYKTHAFFYGSKRSLEKLKKVLNTYGMNYVLYKLSSDGIANVVKGIKKACESPRKYHEKFIECSCMYMNIKCLEVEKLTYIDVISLSWLFMNYIALKQALNNKNIIVITYEDFTSKNIDFEKLSKLIDIRLNIDYIMKNVKNMNKENSKLRKTIENRLKELKIYDMYLELQEMIEKTKLK